MAHGRVMELDLEPARSVTGVVAAYGPGDLALGDLLASAGPGAHRSLARPALAGDHVRFAGEAIAVVVAETEAAAAEGVGAVWPEMTIFAPVAPAAVAARDEELLFPEHGSNVVIRDRVACGDPTPRPGEITVRLEVEHPRLAPLAMEPLGCMAEPSPGGGVTLIVGSQAPHRLRDELARALGIEAGAVRVVVPDVGGAFGARGAMYPEYVVVARCAVMLDRPIRWLATRREDLLVAGHGRGQATTIELIGDPSGRVRAARIDIVADVGAYPHRGWFVSGNTLRMAQGPYALESVEVTRSVVVTSTVPTGPYRGAGRPEAALAIDRAVDAFAHRVGLDPLEVKRRNLIASEALPLTTCTGAMYDGGDYGLALERVCEIVGAREIRERQATERESTASGPLLGLGAAVVLDQAAGAPPGLGEYAAVEVTTEGIVVRTGSTSSGQGHETVWSAVVAGALGVAPEEVRYVAGDTAEVAAGTGTFGSRSAQVGASAVWKCAVEVREVMVGLAAYLLEAAEADIVLHGGAAHVVGHPDIAVPLRDVVAHAGELGVELRSEGEFVPAAPTYPSGAHAAVVRVDPETGAVRLVRYAAVDDCGRVLNSMVVAGQVHGSVVQGIGQAIFEQVVFDEAGQLQTGTLIDYPIPTAADVPWVETARLETPAASNPLGVKGVGEAGCIGAPPAIVNAVVDALSGLGVVHVDMPLRPGRVWQAIAAARSSLVGR
jgi:aerobic carbon-monoxide dehydrogenase large subunit